LPEIICPVIKAQVKNADANVKHVYIYGDICNEQSPYAAEYGIVSLSGVLKQLQSGDQDFTEIHVHIHTRGGDVVEGFAIHDLLVNTAKKVTTIIEGLCASIGTVISLAGSVRKMNKNSDFFIHNPWGEPWSMSGFTADDYEQRAEEIRQAENKILDFYVAKTGADRDTLATMMKEQTTLTADSALEFKFITEIVETVNAYASLGISQKQNTDMKNKNKAASLLARAMKFLKGEDVKNLDLTKKDGTQIVVDTDESTPAVGDAVTVNGEPIADGDHLMSDDSTIVTAGGTIAEIKPAEAPADTTTTTETTTADTATADTAALQAQIDALTAQIAEINARNTALAAEAEAHRLENVELTNQAAAFLAQAKRISSTFTPKQREFMTSTTENKKVSEGNVDVAAAVERRKKLLAEKAGK